MAVVHWCIYRIGRMLLMVKSWKSVLVFMVCKVKIFIGQLVLDVLNPLLLFFSELFRAPIMWSVMQFSGTAAHFPLWLCQMTSDGFSTCSLYSHNHCFSVIWLYNTLLCQWMHVLCHLQTKTRPGRELHTDWILLWHVGLYAFAMSSSPTSKTSTPLK